MSPGAAQAIPALRDAFVRRYPGDVAKLLDPLPATEIADLLRRLPADRGAAILLGLTPDVAVRVEEALPREVAARILEALDPVRAAALLTRMEEGARTELLGLLPGTAASELLGLMRYGPDTAGSLMDPRVLAFHPETPASRALARIRTWIQGGGPRIHEIFLIGVDGRLTGSVPLHDLAVASAASPLAGLSTGAPPSVRGAASREEVVDVLKESGLPSLPVVDFEGRLVGAIRHATQVEAAQQQIATEMVKMTGASAEERALSSVGFGIRKRLPWLHVNLATAFLAAAVVGLFESTIASFTALAVLLPVVAGQSGNTGSQALAVTMRGLALREIRVRQWLRVVRKEVALGFLNGCAISLVTALGVWLWSGSPGLAGVIGVAMVGSMALAGLAGAAIPMILTSLGQDPAAASSIILTTVTDVVGFLSFLGLATLAMGIL